MSAADKTKFDGMTAAFVKHFSIANPLLTYNSTTGKCTWTIAASSAGNANMTNAMCSLRDVSGNEVFADMQFSQASIVITINAANNIVADTYTANILVPVML